MLAPTKAHEAQPRRNIRMQQNRRHKSWLYSRRRKLKRRLEWKRSVLQRNKMNKNNVTPSKAANPLHLKLRRKSSLCRAVAAMRGIAPHLG